jgi:hypothetical protein
MGAFLGCVEGGGTGELGDMKWLFYNYWGRSGD